MGNYKYDFNEVKQLADVEVILDHYNLLSTLRKKGDELTGWCMLGDEEHGKQDSFAFNANKGTFQCFSCKKRGSVIDFVRYYEGLTLPEAAERVVEIMTKNQRPARQNRALRRPEIKKPGANTASEAAVLQEAKQILSSRVQNGQKINSIEDAFDFFHLDIGSEDREIFSVLCLDAQLNIISYTRLFYGSTTEVTVSVKEVARKALLDNAVSVICGHNHPSGDVTPSQHDIKLTRKLKKVLATFEIELSDHVIVAKGEVMSMDQHNLIDAPKKNRRKKSQQLSSQKKPMNDEQLEQYFKDSDRRNRMLLGI